MTDPTLFGSSADTALGGMTERAVDATLAAGAGGVATAAERRRIGPVAASPAANGDGFGGDWYGAGGGWAARVNDEAGTSGLGAGVAACGCGGVSVSGATEDPAGWLSAVLGVLREGLNSLGADRLDERLGLVGRVDSAVAAVRSETVAAIAGRRGEAGAAEAVRDQLRESRGKAKRDVRMAGRLEWLPDTAEALAGGAITAQQARMIAEAAEETSINEKELIAAAEGQPVDHFGRTVRDHVNERTAGEDLEERRRRQRERREFSIHPNSDGMFRVSGWLDPLAGARVQTALGTEYRRLVKAEDSKNRATTAQLYADALEALVTREGRGKSLRTTLVVVADYDFVAHQLAAPRLADGTPLAADEFVKLALEAEILPALFDTKGQPLWLGRAKRDASTAQRIALAARDKGCVGCGAANSYCEPHHIKYWENGGPTDLDNLCLLCGHCHHKEVHSKRDAKIVCEPDGNIVMRRPDRKPKDVNRPLRC